MKTKKIILYFAAGIAILLFGYIMARSTVDKPGCGPPRDHAGQEMELPARTSPEDQLPEPHSNRNAAFAEKPQSREIISEKWKDKERLLDDDKSRPASYQKSLEEPAPPEFKFGAAIRLSLEDAKAGEKLDYPNDRLNQKNLTIDGKPVNELQYVYGKHGEMMILGFPHRTEASRVIRMRNQTEGETAAILPKFNYHENRRWYIDGWAWITDNELLGLSHEEDGKSEGIVKSHFYSYDMNTKTLRTLTPPDEVDPYQSLVFHGLNSETGTMKIGDEKGNIFYMRCCK